MKSGPVPNEVAVSSLQDASRQYLLDRCVKPIDFFGGVVEMGGHAKERPAGSVKHGGFDLILFPQLTLQFLGFAWRKPIRGERRTQARFFRQSRLDASNFRE